MMHLLDLLRHFLIETVWAQSPPLPACGNFTSLYGCGPASNILGTKVIPNLAIFFLRVVAAASVLFVVFAGVSMILAFDDAGKRTKARQSIVWTLVGLGLALASQMIVGFLATGNYGQGVPTDFIIGGFIKSMVATLLTLVNVILGVVIIVHGFRMVMAQGKTDQFNSSKAAILHAILGAIVVNAALAIVRVVLTFFVP